MANNEQVAPAARVTLAGGMTVAFEAIDPTTGAFVAGVVVTNAAVKGDDGTPVSGSAQEITITADTTTPLFAPTPALG